MHGCAILAFVYRLAIHHFSRAFKNAGFVGEINQAGENFIVYPVFGEVCVQARQIYAVSIKSRRVEL